jgi:ATP-dependent DNA helicase RecQ
MATEFDQLREELAQGSVPDAVGTRPSLSEENLGSYAAWRLRKAWSDSGLLGPDHAVLFRQVARWNGDRAFASLPNELLKFNEECGITRNVDGVTVAEPFSPGWLDESLPTVLDPKPSLRRPDERFLAEGYLGELQYKKWASPAQREAVWLALKAPPRSTSLIALPTGAGKSLCFQALARFGTGLTVVVVPTVALAHDHLRSAEERFPADSGVKPRAFAADENAQSVLEAVKSHSCRLLFTSPEACVSGRLKTILETAANDGWLENLVIDEAHLIETWGMDFRPDFQVLSALRRTWISGPHSKLRTTLLSATFTKDCLSTLKTLYWDEGSSWKELVSQRLRPEITYFKQKFARSDERDSALLECMWKLPRPAIVYTTEVKEAKRLHRQLRDEGFRRIGCFTGETGPGDRGQLLDDWHSDRIDLMVATSAFGLGVDKPDVRCVVHACMPENLHRYYQEVGRGGRDGMSSVALLLESSHDRKVAKGLAPRLLKPETLQGRWEGMWREAVRPNPTRDEYKIYLDSRPGNLFATETYKEHVRWNKRLFLQLLRAGLIELLGYDVEYPPPTISMRRSHARHAPSDSEMVFRRRIRISARRSRKAARRNSESSRTG